MAAGMSTRMKEFKQLMKIGDLSMAERVVLNFQRAGIKDIVMVTGYQGKLLEKSLQSYGITFLRNEQYANTEMFDSAKIGLEYMKGRCDRILFCPADVPFFTVDTVECLLKEKGDWIVPSYERKAGHPICIDGSFIPEILTYEGGQGLKGALDICGLKPKFLQTEDEGTVIDADTQEDYKHLLELHNSRLMRVKSTVQFVHKKPFFDCGTAYLLKQVDETKSVKQACEQMGISYSKGWTMIHLAEEALGYRIIERQQGGKDGGQAEVTLKGLRLMESFQEYEDKLQKIAEKLYIQMFKDTHLLNDTYGG